MKEFSQSGFRNESPPSLQLSAKLDVETIDNQISEIKSEESKDFEEAGFEEQKNENSELDFEDFQSGFQLHDSKIDHEIEEIERSQIPEDIPIPDVWNDLETFDSPKIETDIEEPVENSEPEILTEPKDHSEDFDDFCQFVDHVVPENPRIENRENSPVNTEIDDDFADFEAVIPSDRKLENQFVEQEQPKIESQSNEFAVDFASFEESPVFPEPEIKQEEQKPQITEEEDDDDFDDFNDFKSADVVFQSHSDFSIEKPSNLNSTLEFMFPQNGEHDFMEENLENLSKKILANLDDPDSTCALEYQYGSSKTSLSLIRSLGIDNRNVVSIF
jgi:hypothetical protein